MMALTTTNNLLVVVGFGRCTGVSTARDNPPNSIPQHLIFPPQNTYTYMPACMHCHVIIKFCSHAIALGKAKCKEIDHCCINKGANHWVLIVSSIDHVDVYCIKLLLLLYRQLIYRIRFFTILIHLAFLNQQEVHSLPLGNELYILQYTVRRSIIVCVTNKYFKIRFQSIGRDEIVMDKFTVTQLEN